MQPLVLIENVSLFIPGDKNRRLILKNINLSIEPGRHYHVAGANGAGKSTLLRLIAGDFSPCSGSITWRDKNGMNDYRLTAKAMTALVSPRLQENCQTQGWDVSGMDVLRGAFWNVPIACASSCQENDGAIKALLDRLDSRLLMQMRLPQMSQGQLRLLLLARALLKNPSILLLDEFADGLDSRHKQKITEVIASQAAKSVIIFSAHETSSLIPLQAEKIYLENGRLSEEKIITPAITPKRRQPTRPGNQTLLALKNATVYIDRSPVLKNINWNMKAGENWRISGANGSGKSTFLRLLAGDEFVAAGGYYKCWSKRLKRPVETLEELRQTAHLVSDLSQALYGYPLNGIELVLSGLDNSAGCYRNYSAPETSQAEEMIGTIFPTENWRQIAHSSIRQLSTGQLRRLFLARSLMGKPEILLLDEPCSGLDGNSRRLFLNMLDALADKGIDGLKPGIVYISHSPEDAPECLNREATFENGQLYHL